MPSLPFSGADSGASTFHPAGSSTARAAPTAARCVYGALAKQIHAERIDERKRTRVEVADDTGEHTSICVEPAQKEHGPQSFVTKSMGALVIEEIDNSTVPLSSAC